MAKQVKINWEIVDKDGNFIDVLSMTKDEKKHYLEQFPDYKCYEIDRFNAGGDSSWESDSKKERKVFRLRLSN
jgi:hypothetical protein